MSASTSYPGSSSSKSRSIMAVIAILMMLLILCPLALAAFPKTADPPQGGVPTVDIGQICKTSYTVYEIVTLGSDTTGVTSFQVKDSITGGYAKFDLMVTKDLPGQLVWTEYVEVPERYMKGNVATSLLVAGDDYIRKNSIIHTRYFDPGGKRWTTYRSCWGAVFATFDNVSVFTLVP